jgi:multicomponent Na+:H+ antiporter subunit D
MNDPIPWLVVLPMAWASLAFVAGPGHGGRLALAGVTAQLILAVILARAVDVDGVHTHHIGGWPPPLGIELAADGLSAVMLLLTQTVALPLIVYARAYFAQAPAGLRYFWPLTGFLLAGMNALFLSADIFNLYVTLELISLGAVGLIAAKGGVDAVAAALRYLLIALLGSGAYLLGVALLYATYGSVSLAILAPLITQDAPQAVALAAGLMVTGLIFKTGLFPAHFWLPPAHAGAPSPVSALLSALVIKGSFYLIVRLWLYLFLPVTASAAAQFLGAFGAAAIVWGSLMALRQVRLKMLIAYSTVAQIGYLFLLFPLVTHNIADAAHSAYRGIALQVLAHGMAKAAMFCAGGAMILSSGRDNITQLAGISGRLPLTLFTFALAGVSLIGLPPSAGFLAKWLLIDAAITSGQWGWVVVMIIGSLLTAAYVFKVLNQTFKEPEQTVAFRPLPRMLEWPPFLLACGSIALGLRGTDVLNLLGMP